MTTQRSVDQARFLDDLVKATRDVPPVADLSGRRIWKRLQAGQMQPKRPTLSVNVLVAALLIFVAGGTVGAAVVVHYKGAAVADPLQRRGAGNVQRKARGKRPTAARQQAILTRAPVEESAVTELSKPPADSSAKKIRTSARELGAKHKRSHDTAGEAIDPVSTAGTIEPPAPTLDVHPPERDTESSSVADILVALRRERAPVKALEMIHAHRKAWPLGRFNQEMQMAELEALMATNDEAGALAQLDVQPSFEGPRRQDLMLLRGQLRAKHGNCARALLDVDLLLGERIHLQPRVLEQALAVKGHCHLQLGNDAQARETLRRYVEMFPLGPFAADARRALRAAP